MTSYDAHHPAGRFLKGITDSPFLQFMYLLGTFFATLAACAAVFKFFYNIAFGYSNADLAKLLENPYFSIVIAFYLVVSMLYQLRKSAEEILKVWTCFKAVYSAVEQCVILFFRLLKWIVSLIGAMIGFIFFVMFLPITTTRNVTLDFAFWLRNKPIAKIAIIAAIINLISPNFTQTDDGHIFMPPPIVYSQFTLRQRPGREPRRTRRR